MAGSAPNTRHAAYETSLKKGGKKKCAAGSHPRPSPASPTPLRGYLLPADADADDDEEEDGPS